MVTDFSDDVHFVHAFHLKFTINANFVYIPVEATFSMSILCPNHHGKYFSSWSVSALLLCPDLSDPSSLTQRTSDNQRLRTSNDTTCVAKYPTLKSHLD